MRTIVVWNNSDSENLCEFEYVRYGFVGWHCSALPAGFSAEGVLIFKPGEVFIHSKQIRCISHLFI